MINSTDRSVAADAPGLQPAPGRLSSYVLVVDDEDVVRDFLVRCLTRAGYAVQPASSAAEALALMVAKAAAIVLCDIRMPGQDGLWLAGRLRDRWPGIPVVMTTAIDDLDTIRTTRELGAVDYLSKPLKADQLLDVVQRVTVGREQQPVAEEELESPEAPLPTDSKIDAEYTLEAPVRCPACGERISTLKAVRLVRAQVNFTSTLPRRGRVLACPHCLAIVSAELTNF